MRKIQQPLRKGIETVTWDMNYMDQRGPSVPPGKYYVSMEKYVNGEYINLDEEKEFTINALDNSALGKPDYKAKFEFLKQASDKYTRISEVYSYASDLKSEMENLRTELVRTPENTNDLMLETKNIEKKLDDIIYAVSGRRTEGVRIDATEPSIMNRMRFAVSATSGSEDDITGAQKEQYGIALARFEQEYVKLEQLYAVELVKLKSNLEMVNIDWSPDILPLFK